MANAKPVSLLADVILAVQPITLNVGVETELWLWVERGLTNTEHTVYARLVRAADDTVGISSQCIKLDVSGTVYALTTDLDGYATQPLNLEAVAGQTTTYQVRAVFEGVGFKTRNLTVTDPYGHDYPVCTTNQWDFKSSQNSATLTVEAPKTDATVSEPASPEDTVTVTQTPETTTVTVPPPKTPEQMQQEATSKGALRIWSEFSWWWPWFKIVAEVDVPINGQIVTFRFEDMPVVFQKIANVTAGAAALARALVEIGVSVSAEVLTSYIIGSFIVPRIAAHIASKASPFAVFAVILIYAGAQALIATILNVLLGKTGLLISIVSLLMAAVIEAFLTGLNILADFIQAIYRGATGAIRSIWHSWWGRGLGFVDIVEATAFFFVDIGLGALLATML